LRKDLHRRRDAIRAIALKHGASNLRVFGSVVRGEERPDSDFDLLIDLAETRGFVDYLALATN
jgi:predicted nucleotidyltransferase